MTTVGVVVAAGRGERFGGEKHAALIGGVPMWRRARDVLLTGGVERVVVVGDVPGGVPGGERRSAPGLGGGRPCRSRHRCRMGGGP